MVCVLISSPTLQPLFHAVGAEGGNIGGQVQEMVFARIHPLVIRQIDIMAYACEMPENKPCIRNSNSVVLWYYLNRP
jgi:hypothetical protein